VMIAALCSCKQKGCTDRQSLNYDSDAEENDGSCNYISGTYNVTENCGQPDHFNITIPGNGIYFTITNFANIFSSVSAVRIGFGITIDSQEVQDRWGDMRSVHGSGSVSVDGKTLSLNYTIDNMSCSATGTK